jgi:DNA invertase Pin-like site-specific DNA recombinase
MTDSPSLVAYYRVSTDKQGITGLGMEAQQEAVRRHAKAVGGSIVAEFIEVERGAKSDRPELLRALTHARRTKATLCVAKLDRLSRNVAFLASLMESKVSFVACDNPSANSLTLHVMAAVAEHEAKAISERTKAALAAYKARGGTLGGSRPGSAAFTPEMRQKGNQAGSRANRERAMAEYSDVAPIVMECRSAGMSLRQIVEALHSQGFTTVQGSKFTATTVKRIIDRTK